MRELLSIALVIGLAVCATGSVAAGDQATASTEPASTESAAATDPDARQRAKDVLTDRLFSDEIDRIDIRAETFDDATKLIEAAADKVLDIALPVLGNADAVADKGLAVIDALNESAARGLYTTFGRSKQNLVVKSLGDADALGEIIGGTISIIAKYYGSSDISFLDKAGNLFHKVRMNPEDSETMLDLHLSTVQYVQGRSVKEQAQFLN